MRPQHKVALITGAARRIGRAIATYLHQNNYHIIIHYHRSEKEAQVFHNHCNQQRPNSAAMVAQDLCAANAASLLIQQSLDAFGRLDVLVNNASIFLNDALAEARWEELQRCNSLVPYQLSHTAFPHLRKHKGAIINISDIHAHKPLKCYSLYCQSKAALHMQTLSLAREFAPSVRVNAIAPGAIDWPEGTNSLSDDEKTKIINKTPLHRHGDPVYIAQAVHAIAENPFITGQSLAVDGGRSIT